MKLELHELEFNARFLFFLIFFFKFDRPILDFIQDFEKIEFQNRGISLFSLGKEAKYWIFSVKGAKANFLLVC